MIKLIVGLGNPGSQYDKTRHNAGFLFLDYMLDKFGGSWSADARFNALVADCRISGVKVILLKPQTFMNRSGLSVGAVSRYYKIPVDEILVVHDELDLPVGVVKLKKSGGHAGHNGLRDIIANLSSRDFYRLRLGIGRPVAGKKVADYVLSVPSKVDVELINDCFVWVENFFSRIVGEDVSKVMSELNAKK